MEQVPVIVLDHLTETQKRAYILADNRLTEIAGWDEELLRLELQALRATDFSLDLTGFDGKELNRLLAEQVPSGLTDGGSCPSRGSALRVVGREGTACSRRAGFLLARCASQRNARKCMRYW
jgi:hypothetical protein